MSPVGVISLNQFIPQLARATSNPIHHFATTSITGLIFLTIFVYPAVSQVSPILALLSRKTRFQLGSFQLVLPFSSCAEPICYSCIWKAHTLFKNNTPPKTALQVAFFFTNKLTKMVSEFPQNCTSNMDYATQQSKGRPLCLIESFLMLIFNYDFSMSTDIWIKFRDICTITSTYQLL